MGALITVLPVFFPILAGICLLPVKFKERKQREQWVLTIVVLNAIFALFAIWIGKADAFTLFHFIDKRSLVLRMDGLSKVFGTLTQSMTINLDPSLTNVSGITEAKVTVTVEGLVTKTLEAGNIEIVNKPGGYEITRNTQSCTVLIRGTQEAVDAVTASQVRIVADLSNLDLSTGSRTVPVKVYLDGSSEVGVVGEYNISISVSRS